jgi:dimethylhistidine N-methyltransferase
MSDSATGLKPASTSLAFFEDRHPPASDFGRDVREGLSGDPKTLSPIYFYDARGSAIFDAITDTPEYYVTRTELGVLETHGAEIADRAGPRAVVIEPGSGSSVKIRHLLDALNAPAGYVGLDISKDHLFAACNELAADYPDLEIGAVCADFTDGLDLAGLDFPPGRRLIFFPGSTIGNFEPEDAREVLAGFRQGMRPGDAVLLGVDQVKARETLEAAYDDGDGVTADFNLNLIDRMNRELGGDIDRAGFRHRAIWNAEAARIEMHLEALQDMAFTVAGEKFSMRKGETIHTENSHKFTQESFSALADAAGFSVDASWRDADGLFALHWLVPKPEA